MAWRPNMSALQRAKLNASRRKTYAKRRRKQGKPYHSQEQGLVEQGLETEPKLEEAKALIRSLINDHKPTSSKKGPLDTNS